MVAGARCTVFCALSRAALDAHAGPEGCYFDSDCLPHRPSRRALQVLLSAKCLLTGNEDTAEYRCSGTVFHSL